MQTTPTTQKAGAEPEIRPHTQVNLDAFNTRLATEYAILFGSDPDYAYSAARNTPSALARKMTLALASGSGNKDGKGIARTCKALSIPYTYKGIRAYFDAK